MIGAQFNGSGGCEVKLETDLVDKNVTIQVFKD